MEDESHIYEDVRKGSYIMAIMPISSFMKQNIILVNSQKVKY